MPAGLDPEALRARLERARLAQAYSNVTVPANGSDVSDAPPSGPVRPPTRGYMPSPPASPHVPLPYAAFRPARPVDLGVFDKTFETADELQGSPIYDWGTSPLGDRVRQALSTPGPHHTRQSPQPSLWDRFLFNEADQYDNTLMGATGLLPPQLAPTGRMSMQRWNQLIREAAQRRQAFRRREKFPLPAPDGLGQWAAAGLGYLAGKARAPENWIWWSPPGRLPALMFDGLMGLAPDLMVQDMQIRAGLRNKVDAGEAIAAGAGNIAQNRMFDIGKTVLRGGWEMVQPEWGQLRTVVARNLGKAGNAVGRGWDEVLGAADDQLGRAGDPKRNFEAWQYLKDLLQGRLDSYSNPDGQWMQASPRPDIPGAMPRS